MQHIQKKLFCYWIARSWDTTAGVGDIEGQKMQYFGMRNFCTISAPGNIAQLSKPPVISSSSFLFFWKLCQPQKWELQITKFKKYPGSKSYQKLQTRKYLRHKFFLFFFFFGFRTFFFFSKNKSLTECLEMHHYQLQPPQNLPSPKCLISSSPFFLTLIKKSEMTLLPKLFAVSRFSAFLKTNVDNNLFFLCVSFGSSLYQVGIVLYFVIFWLCFCDRLW